MWLEQVGPIITALAGLVVAGAGALKVRAGRLSSRLTDCHQRLEETEEEAEEYRQVALRALRHIFKLEKALAARGVTPPARPSDLQF